MSEPPVCTPLGITTLSHSPVCTTVLCLGHLPVLPPLAKPPDAISSSPMDLLLAPFLVSSLPLLCPLFPGFHLQSSPVALVSVLPISLEGAACRGPPLYLKLAPVPLWWVMLGLSLPFSTTSLYFPTLTSSVLPLLAL